MFWLDSSDSENENKKVPFLSSNSDPKKFHKPTVITIELSDDDLSNH